ncbi:U5 small nuclear ribonucleoprotein TSSC4-like [Ruditapes philippinarum]|uniref:U5 small nuclear ribonucleoprotein TSSC4-like n=1 Tax=Ruditapes philippinarum TaxID=129788 RepID=UPI00295AA550|nr:U5 small nuclear ribonucleoprotein TSSC4-like [Ruditapes philippinarum]
MDDIEESKTVPVFQLQNSGLNDRCKDVFGSLDALEQKHQAFERSRAREDADSDRHLIHQTPVDDDADTSTETFKRPTFTGRDYHESRKGGRHGHERSEQQFRKPMPPQSQFRGRNSSRGRYGRSRGVPDYKVHPERWTEYSLEDVDTSDSANKKAALDFLHERRKMREGEIKEKGVDLESNACSKGLITFKRPSKQTDSGQNSDKNKQKPSSSYEKMEDDSSDPIDDKLDSSIDIKSESSLKRKLEKIDLEDEADKTVEEKSVGFKSRKKIKRNFRAPRDIDTDDTNE